MLISTWVDLQIPFCVNLFFQHYYSLFLNLCFPKKFWNGGFNCVRNCEWNIENLTCGWLKTHNFAYLFCRVNDDITLMWRFTCCNNNIFQCKRGSAFGLKFTQLHLSVYSQAVCPPFVVTWHILEKLVNRSINARKWITSTSKRWKLIAFHIPSVTYIYSSFEHWLWYYTSPAVVGKIIFFFVFASYISGYLAVMRLTHKVPAYWNCRLHFRIDMHRRQLPMCVLF